jgi:homoserine dehydrogenase
MLGFGTVGAAAYQMLIENRAVIGRRVGTGIDVAGIGVRDAGKPRGADAKLFTTDLNRLVDDPKVAVVLELMGGVHPAIDLVERALRNGKHVVTANKEMLAKHGPRLVHLAATLGRDLHFEAAVGGGIPLIQPIKHQLAGNDLIKLIGILNGTTNFVLSQMSETDCDFDSALEEARRRGYAEADPRNDVGGFDAQYKLAILSSIAFGQEVPPEGVYREGIEGIKPKDIHFADVLGYRIKPLGIVEAVAEGIQARVHPALLPKSHPLASVNDVYNAVWIRGDFVGDVMFSGRGAGGNPTSSAVIGDLIDVCRNIRLGGAGNLVPYGPPIRTLPIEQLVTRYYLRMIVQDRPKALGCIATVFGNCGISLAAMEIGRDRVFDAPGHRKRVSAFGQGPPEHPHCRADRQLVQGGGMRIACIQADVVLGDPKANSSRVVRELRRLKEFGVDLAVFPECFLTGYCVSGEPEARSIALRVVTRDGLNVHEAPKPILDVQRACADLGIHAVVGFAGDSGTDLFNGAIMFGTRGEMLLYRKSHLPELGFDKFVKAGDRLPVFDTELGRIGILICFDQRVPESARVLALRGAELIVLPTNWPEGAENSADVMCVARAAENRVFYAACNRVGTERGFRFIGRSKILDPSGKILAAAGEGEETISADVDLSQARQKRAVVRPGEYEWTVFDSRRPELYGPITNDLGR